MKTRPGEAHQEQPPSMIHSQYCNRKSRDLEMLEIDAFQIFP